MKRCNYQVAIWKRALEPMPEVPAANNGHGWIAIDGILEPLWSTEGEELILPTALVDIFEDIPDSDNNDDVSVLPRELEVLFSS